MTMGVWRWGIPPQPADTDDWETDPFVLTGQDGYLYGRGSSDNKGSVLAAIFAAALCRTPDMAFGSEVHDDLR